ncbi:MAG: hypothetical protein IH621_18650 [Krumholzibacteria bacterium]|nr:hypothetical protein [Candidatus Krumholzibacteria bacterium]
MPKKGELETCKAEIQRAAAILRGVDVRTMIFVDTSLPANCQPERLPWENDGPPYTQAVQMLDGIAAAIDTAIAELGPRRGPSIKKAATSRLLTALTVGLLHAYMRSTGRTPAISEASSDRFASLLAHAFELLGEGRSYVRRYIAEARALIQD